MDKEQREKLLKALDTFDRAAQAHGWHQDRGGQTTAYRAKRLYKAAKTRLISMLEDVTSKKDLT